MVWGSVIAGGLGVAGGLMGGQSAKAAYKSAGRKVKKYTREAQDIYGQYSPELLDIYRGILPELSSVWSGQKERVSDMFRGRYQETADASQKRTADVRQQLARSGLGGTTNTEAFNRAQQAQDVRDAMVVDAAKAGVYQQLAAAEAASKLQGRGLAGAGIGNVAQMLTSFPMNISNFYASEVGQAPYMQPNGQALGWLGAGLGDLLPQIFGKLGGKTTPAPGKPGGEPDLGTAK